MVTKFCMVARNIRDVLSMELASRHHVTLLSPRILRWSLGFWKICAPLF